MQTGPTLEQKMRAFLAARELNPGLTPEEFCRGEPELLVGILQVLQTITPHAEDTNSFSQPPLAVNLLPRSPGSSAGGQLRLGVYLLGEKIGEGGMGIVHRARDTRLDRTVAVKLMRPDVAAQPQARARFLREARAMAAVRNDHVAVIHAADEQSDGTTWLAMELLEGESLNDAIKAGRTFSWREIVRIGREIATGLHAAHLKQLIHRDIKPANIWLEGPEQRVKILDFGLARVLGTEIELTASGTPLGTPAYMSPEQADAKRVDARCDLFSLGAVLYRLATGKLPFPGGTIMATLRSLVSEEPPPVRVAKPDCPPALEQLIMRLLSKDREARPANARLVVEELRAIERSLPDADGTPVIFVETLPDHDPWTALDEDSASPASESRPNISETSVGTLVQRPPAGARLMRWPWWWAVPVLVVSIVAGVWFRPNSQKAPANPGVAVAEKPATRPSKPVVVKPVVPAGKVPGEEREFEIYDGVRMIFCWIPPGEAPLGMPAGELAELMKIPPENRPERLDTETEAVRGKYKTAGFWLGKHEVTQATWLAVMGEQGNFSSNPGPRLPVENVSWNDCQNFIAKCRVSGVRLPHENEWEYACRGGLGNQRAYYWGNALKGDKANCDGNHPYGTLEKGPNPEKTTEVGSYEKIAPHPWGLCDMHGNVWEWCENAESSDDPEKVFRGGSWINGPADCRAARRNKFPSTEHSNVVGFRLALGS